MSVGDGDPGRTAYCVICVAFFEKKLDRMQSVVERNQGLNDDSLLKTSALPGPALGLLPVVDVIIKPPFGGW